jgi:proline racemase
MQMAPIRTVDYHTGGEPFRIVPEPPVALPGATVAERRVFALHDPAADGLRRLLCFEPIVGSRFTAVATAGPDGAVIPVISGMAYPTGEHVFTVDPADPLAPGFVLR